MTNGQGNAMRERGWTLIETLVVIIILGILAAIAVPVFVNEKRKNQPVPAGQEWTDIGKDPSGYSIKVRCEGTSLLLATHGAPVTATANDPHCADGQYNPDPAVQPSTGYGY